MKIKVWPRYYSPNYAGVGVIPNDTKLLHPVWNYEIAAGTTFVFDVLDETCEDEWLLNQTVGSLSALCAIRDKHSGNVTIHFLYDCKDEEVYGVPPQFKDLPEPILDGMRQVNRQFYSIFTYGVYLVNNYLPMEVIALTIACLWEYHAFSYAKYRQLRKEGKNIHEFDTYKDYLYCKASMTYTVDIEHLESQKFIRNSRWNRFCRQWHLLDIGNSCYHCDFTRVLQHIADDEFGRDRLVLPRINPIVIGAIRQVSNGGWPTAKYVFHPAYNTEEFDLGAYASIMAGIMMYLRHDAGVDDFDHYVASHLWTELDHYVHDNVGWKHLREAFEYLCKLAEDHMDPAALR